MAKISIVIPVYNALEDVKLCLKSILNNIDFSLCEVIVINDCSKEDTTEYLTQFQKEYAKIEIIRNNENLGFVKTCNKGMKKTSGDIVILLNSDTILPKNFCEKIIQCFESDKEIGLASPIGSYTADFYIPIEKSYTLEQMNELLCEKHTCKYPLIYAAEGFCFCIRREVINQQGYLDEVYGKGYDEEIDYAFRAITNGWKNVLIDNLYVYHKRQASFGADTRKQLLEQNYPIFKSRWNGFRQKYEKEHNILTNPVKEIEAKMFPDRHPDCCKLSFFEKIFSIKNSNNKQYKIYTVLGFSVKYKRNKSNDKN